MSNRSYFGPTARGLGLSCALVLATASGCTDDETPGSEQPGTKPDAGGRPDAGDSLDAGNTHDANDTEGGGESEDAGESADASAETDDDASAADDGQSAQRPNILLIVADDLGYSDIGAFGGEIRTPNLDLLASEGRLVTDHHSAMTCAPTRSMLISGTDHHLVGLGRMGAGTGDQAGQPGYEGYLNTARSSIAELLKDRLPQRISPHSGTLGDRDDQTPLQRGYERSFVLLPGVWSHYLDFDTPPTEAQLKLYREDGQYKTPPSGYYATNYFTERLIEFIDSNKQDEKPFYAFAAYTSPHGRCRRPRFIDRTVVYMTRATTRSARRASLVRSSSGSSPRTTSCLRFSRRRPRASCGAS